MSEEKARGRKGFPGQEALERTRRANLSLGWTGAATHQQWCGSAEGDRGKTREGRAVRDPG